MTARPPPRTRPIHTRKLVLIILSSLSHRTYGLENRARAHVVLLALAPAPPPHLRLPPRAGASRIPFCGEEPRDSEDPVPVRFAASVDPGVHNIPFEACGLASQPSFVLDRESHGYFRECILIPFVRSK
ncbi:uncharacterized protein SCHCODRAFT_02486553 [Schizophyllum commune H4-8]|uniref:uncharacterized protein n=1 Tax=Schizophyllum commune (strain H4-8 / FGSC 9210) TaxID=578458 RepID=UPI00215E0CEF|nr:uncharacterized protein SCHCODRAFT_02486553 [Schizophyllum commune H4-8]KAI5898627.1 hypothetical protein SCHCODRAFT_02486553 [Schizophyllum commune H4-8]